MLKIGDTLDESYKYNGPEINGEYKRVFKVVAIAKPGSLITLPSDSTIFDVFINDYAIYAPLTTWKYYLTDKTKDKTYINKAITDQEKYNLEYKVDGNKVVIYNDDFTNAIINLDFEIVVEKNINIDTVKQLCNQVGKKNGSNLEFIQLENKNKPLIEILNQSCIGVLVFSIVLFLFSVFGIAGTTLYSISNRKKEFGIRMSQGATLYEIAILIFNEILFTNVIAAVVVIVPFKVLETYLNKYLNNNIELSYLLSFSFRNLLEVLILVLITTILAAIIPMRQVMKLNIVELLRGGN
jgi:ABC-type antimicrobial peptide transport system permease subunit